MDDLRKKLTRAEEENEALALQIKKMAVKSKAGKRFVPHSVLEDS